MILNCLDVYSLANILRIARRFDGILGGLVHASDVLCGEACEGRAIVGYLMAGLKW